MKVLLVLIAVCFVLMFLPVSAFAAGEPPVLQGAEVIENGAVVELTFDKDMAPPEIGSAGFAVMFGVTDKQVTAAQLDGADSNKIRLSLTTTVKGGEDVWLSYTPGTVSAADGGALAAISPYYFSNNLPRPVLDSSSPPGGTLNVPYSHTFATSGGQEPYTFSDAGGLPPGLSLDPDTGVLSGTPTASGSFNFGIYVVDSNSAIDSRAYSITVAEVSNVCQIGAEGEGYATLDTALAAVDNGETITLLVDITDNDGLVINNGKSFTIDLDGHTLNVTNPEDSAKGLEVTNGSTVGLDDSSSGGAFNVSGSAYGAYANDATVTVSSAMAGDGTAVVALNNANITVTGNAEGANGGIFASNASAVTVNGDVESANDGTVAVNAQNSTIHVSGSVIATGGGSSHGILGSGNITVDGDVEGNQIGAEVGGFPSVINVGGNVTARGTDNAGAGFFCFGALTTGGDLNIGGNISAAGGTGARSTGGGEMTIDGTITAAHYIEFVFGLDHIVKTIDDKAATTTKEGYDTYTDGNGEIWVKATPAPTGVCQIGATQYATLDDALGTVGPGQTATIKLLDNITYNKGIEISGGQSITFDLDGHTLNIVNSSGIGLLVTSGHVTYTNPGAAGAFHVTGDTCGVSANGGGASASVSSATATSDGGNGAVALNGGDVVVNGSVQGGYNGASAAGVGSTIIVNGNATGTYDPVSSAGARAGFGASVTIDGGNAQGVMYGVYANGNDSLITINGGNAIGTGTYSHGAHAEGDGSIHVTGNVQGTQHGVYASGSSSYVTVTGNVTVTAALNGWGVDVESNGTVQVGGNVVANGQSLGVFATSGGNATIDGVIQALPSKYIQIFNTVTEQPVYMDGSPGSRTNPTTKDGYYTYSAGPSTVWVRIPAADTTPPVWTSGYPHTFNLQDEDLILVVSANENCTVYYVVLADGAAAPSADQVQNLRDAGGNEVPGGYLPYTNPPNDRNHWVGELTPETAYDIYVVLMDVEGNLQAEPARIDVTTLPDIDTIPNDANSGITDQAQGPAGSRQVTLTVTVRNAAGEAITGIGPGYFEVSINGGLTRQFVNDPPFSGFSDKGDGTYTVVFTGDAHSAECSFTNLTVFGVVIEAGPTTVTTPPAGADTTPPTIETYSPADDTTDVAIDTNLVLTFSEDVTTVSGCVYLHETDNTTVAIAVYGAAVSVSGHTVTIDPGDLEYSTGYYVTIDAGAFEDMAGNSYAGISGSGTWNFTTVAEGGTPADTTPPTVPGGPRVIDRTTSSITIAWDASTDASGIAGYDIQMKQGNGGTYSIVGSTNGNETEFTKSGLNASTTYYFQVRARDGSSNANVSNWSVGISATTRSSSGGGGGGSTTPQPVNSTTGSATVTPSAGGTVGLGKEASVTVPAGALQGSDGVQVSVQKADVPPAAPSGFMVMGAAYQFTVNGQDHYTFNQPVTLTFTFDTAALAPGETPAVYYYDEARGQWVNIGGTVSGNTITVTVDHFTRFTVMAKQEEKKEEKPEEKPVPILNDIAGHWAENNINQLITLGAVTGYPDHTFKPDHSITRAEFAAILIKAFKLTPQSGKVFADTAGHWAKDSIATAAYYGIVSGYDDAHFGPDDPITREQMAAMIVRSLKLTTVSEKTTFTDSADISAWANSAVVAVVKSGIIKGYPDNTYRPRGNATRAETATAIINALKC